MTAWFGADASAIALPSWWQVVHKDRIWWHYRVVLPLIIGGLVIAAVLTFRAKYDLVLAVRQDPSQRCIPGTIFLLERGAPVERGQLGMIVTRNFGRLSDGINVIKVVAGVPGDTLDVRADHVTDATGKVYRTSMWDAAEMLKEDARALEREVVLGEGEVFMLGTNPGSYDSRFVGSVKMENVVGRAYLVL